MDFFGSSNILAWPVDAKLKDEDPLFENRAWCRCLVVENAKVHADFASDMNIFSRESI